MAHYLRVVGEGGHEFVVDLDVYPRAQKLIDSKALKVVEELDEAPPDPWAEPAPHKRARAAKAAKADADVPEAPEAAEEG